MKQADYKGFYKAAKAAFGERAINDYLRCYAYGTEASCYRYVPKVVVIAKCEADISTCFKLANLYNTPLCFRASGSSLSGQSSCESVLVVMKFSFKQILAKDDEITLGAGVLGQDANDYLAPLSKKIGPDPATISTALIGGILSNNSSGMCCGVADNSYKTLKSLRIMLADGTLLDTSDPASVANFRITHKALLDELSAMQEEIFKDKELHDLIEQKFKIKNTTGYSLNALIDFKDPIDILTHLFIGAEGTLGCILKANLKILDDAPHKACALLFYENINDAARAIIDFNQQDFLASAEIMDYACLKTASKYPEIAELLKDIKPGSTCVLVQAEAFSTKDINQKIELIKQFANTTNLRLSTDASEYALWWKIRKALLPIAASSRREGSTVITEDLCFKIEDLAAGIAKTQELFNEFGFSDNGIIFGHALAGNIHFIITPMLQDAKEFKNFSDLVDKMSHEVAAKMGSIKAEHGTGRMIAPFVELEWGKKAYELNRRIKNLLDPNNLCNPDVIICQDADIYKKNIKSAPKIDERLNSCMECGMCERFCPSAEHSLSPRQRIAVLREIERLKDDDSKEAKFNLASIKKGYEYYVNETCAACSMCSLGCPLGIDVAKFTTNYRHQHAGVLIRSINALAYKHHAKALKLASKALDIANKFDNYKLDKLASKFGKRSFSYLPQANLKEPAFAQRAKNAIYFGSCLNKAMRPNSKMHDLRSLAEVATSLASKAGWGLIQAPSNLCCGKAYDHSASVQEQNKPKLAAWLAEQSTPIILDHSACASKMFKQFGRTYVGKDGNEYPIYDLVEFAALILDDLEIKPLSENIGLYLMCAARTSKLEAPLEKIAKACTNGQIIRDFNTHCCGFAGYKGFLTSALNSGALKGFKRFYSRAGCSRGFSSSSTCEIGLAEATSMSWQHIAYLLDEVSK